MAVDLKKYGTDMKNASNDVMNDKTETDWALFGYEGQTNVIKLMATGDGGLDELIEDFNPSKIQYALLKVEDSKTSLPKFVLINWQGESTPGVRKGSCAMHFRDVERFLSGHHLTVSVRNEDELDISTIMDKVSRVSASSYNFKEKPQGMEHSPAPVGTAHKKINPQAELPDMNTREKFWARDQEQEKVRITEERARREKEKQEVETARLRREEEDGKVRDQQIKERERKISNLREMEAGENSGNKDQARWEEQKRLDALDDEERRNRSEVMRQTRNKEAAALLAGRGSEAKKVFQRNSSQGQMNFGSELRRSTDQKPPVLAAKTFPPPKPVDTVREVREVKEVKEEVTVSKPEPVPEPEPMNDIAPPPPAFDGSPEPEDSKQENGGPVKDDNLHLHHASPANVSSSNQEEEASEVSVLGGAASPNMESYGTCAVALYDYQAADETEISFDPGQIISHIDQIDPGWWQGLGPDGNYGLFPANYVEIIDNKELQIM